MNRYYKKSISESIIDFIKEIFNFLLKILEAPFAYLLWFTALIFISFGVLLSFFGGGSGSRNGIDTLYHIIGMIISSPPVIQIFVVTVLSLMVIISIIPRIFTSLESVFFEDSNPGELIHFARYTGMPLILLVIITIEVLKKWNPSIPMTGDWPLSAILLTMGLAILFLIFTIFSRFFKDIIITFIPNQFLTNLIFLIIGIALLISSFMINLVIR